MSAHALALAGPCRVVQSIIRGGERSSQLTSLLGILRPCLTCKVASDVKAAHGCGITVRDVQRIRARVHRDGVRHPQLPLG